MSKKSDASFKAKGVLKTAAGKAKGVVGKAAAKAKKKM
jgi:hypothetical protein